MGLGRIVYATASSQLAQWRSEWGAPAGPVATLPIQTVAPGIPVSGPAPELVDDVKQLQRRLVDRQSSGAAQRKE